MNNRQIHQVFNAYKKETPIPEIFVATNRRRFSRLALAASMFVALLSLTTVALWPRESLAAAMARMDNAIINVESMRATVTVNRDGHNRHIATYTYWKGLWRYENFVGTPLESVGIFSRDHMVFHQRGESYVTVGMPYAVEMLPPRSALEYVKSTIDSGAVGVERQMELRDGPPVDGRATYIIVATRPNNAYHAEILVDSNTDLPIRASIDVRYDDGKRDHHTWKFEWNARLDKASFTAESFRLPIINRDIQIQELKKAWAKPLAVIRIKETESKMRNVFVANDGTVFLAYTHHPDTRGLAPIPITLTDDTGNVYARASEYAPGGVYGEAPVREAMALDGGEMRFSVFIPADTDVSTRHFDVQWQLGRSTWPASSDEDHMFQGPSETTTLVAPIPSDAEFPLYSAAMVIDHYHLQKRLEIARVRAQVLFDLGRFEDAADWGWHAYDRYQRFIPRIAYRELPTVVKALKASGRAEEAREVERRYRVEQETDEAYMRQ